MRSICIIFLLIFSWDALAGVTNGQPVNASTTNAAFVDKNTSWTFTTAVADLQGGIETKVASDSTSTGSNQNVTLLAPITIYTNASLSSIENITLANRQDGSLITVRNATGGTLTLVNLSGGTASKQINTGTGSNLSISNGGSAQLYYDTVNSVWQNIVPSSTATLSVTAPTVQKFTSTGTQTGWLFTISTSTTCSVGDQYTNNGHTYTVQYALSTQSGQVLYMSGTGATSGTTLTRSVGSGTASITFSATVATATYTTPSSPSPLYLKVKLVGGGGGGGGGSNAAGTGGTGSAGTITSFGGNALIAGPGAGASGTGSGGAGGGTNSTTAGPLILVNVAGGQGGSDFRNPSAAYLLPGAMGGSSCFGGGGSGAPNAVGTAGAANTGGGGGGGSSTSVSSASNGAGGGAGGCLEAIITSPVSSYVYLIATGGGGGSGTGGAPNGGTGGTGYLVVEEHYQ